MSAPSTGSTLPTVIVAFEVTGGLTPSAAVSVAVTTASSSHVIDGVRVLAPEIEHCVPGSAALVIDHDVVIGSLSVSVTVAFRGTGVPSVPAYGPPADATGATLWRVMMRIWSRPFVPALRETWSVRWSGNSVTASGSGA